MTMTVHAAHRTARLIHAGLPEAAAKICLTHANLIAEKYPSMDVAACITRLPRPYGIRGDESNGNEVWAICRRGEVVTLMLRRSEQATTPGQMSVDRVVG